MAIEVTSDLSLVGTSQIVDGAVTSAKIAAGAVGSAALASGAVVAAAIAAGSVGTVAISSGSATSGQILQANGSGAVTFETPAAGGGMTLIATATPSGATTISFTSIPGTYKHLMLIWTGMFQSVTGEQFFVRMNNDSAAVYDYNGISATGSTVSDITSADATGFGQLNGSTAAPIALTASSAADLTKTSNGVMMIYRYTDTGNRHVEWSQTSFRTAATSGYIWNNVRGVYSPTAGSAIDRIDFIRAATQTITGTVYLYGVS